MRKTLLTLLLVCTATLGFAQRVTDKIDRGLVAVPGQSGGNFISWHVFGEEYYDVTYNLYCNGSLLAQNLNVSSYTHASGNSSSKYQVAAVVRGVEQEKCAAVTRWANQYMDVTISGVTNRNGVDVTSGYEINDISLGDVNGDGVQEFIVKRNNRSGNLTTEGNTTDFNLYECYTIKGKRLWWIDLGPNLMAGPDEQWDLIAFDWDQDGKAECVMRGADNMIIHTASGKAINIGNMNYYAPRDEYTHQGAEYLLYLNGETGEPYGWDGSSSNFTPMAYPLPRFEQGESDYATVWGKADTGHRSSKHYFGAPFLDGRKASIFLGRGCYTRHKMCALDVDSTTHQLTQRWRWNEYDNSSPWFGNGFHNFAIADVDWDGRDEIVFGSMVIDDNGKGLCTTALGHGDAQHCADLDPYRHGQEQFTCNETSPACTYYNATTGQIYYRLASGGDDGRALCANFSNDFPGSLGRSTQTGLVSTVADKVIENGPATGGTNDALYWSHLNQRIYWDGDLLDEVFDSPGSEARNGAVYKPGGGRLITFEGTNTANSSKNNPGAIADLFGDWREEVVMRSGTQGSKTIRIFTTNIPTDYSVYTLWHDHQYRNAMVWQCVGYNQPPHKSYFLGQMEGITVAPPPLTMTGRTEVTNGGTIGTSLNDQHVIVCETGNTAISVAEGAKPYIVTFNVPSWVQGTNSNILNGGAKINYEYYTCNVSGAAFGGNMRLIKQGDGILTLPAVDMTYTGETNIWAGTVNFNGSAQNSPVWLNRFGELNSNAESATFKSLKADYASIVRPGGESAIGTITATESYHMGFGSRLVLDLYSDGLKADKVVTSYLTIEKKNWKYGPQYLMPVIEVVEHKAEGAETLEPGRYLIAHVDSISGSLANIKVEGVTSLKSGLELDEKGDIYLVLGSVRGASEIIWSGSSSNVWDYATSENFYLADDETKTPDIFVKGDIVNFTDSATQFTVTLKDGTELPADTIRFNNTKSYTLNGNGKIVAGAYVKENTGTVTMSGDNTYTGGNYLRGGITRVSSLSNSTQAYGNLGGITTGSQRFAMENGAELQTTADVKMGSPMRMQGDEGGVINNSKSFVMEKLLTGTKLTKKGAGTLTQQGSLSVKALTVAAGTVSYSAGTFNNPTTLQGTGVLTGTGFLATPIRVEKGAKAALWGVNRATSSNKITGEGQITIYCATEKGGSGSSIYYATRSPMQLNLTEFEGTLVIGATNNEVASNGATGRVFTFDTNTGAPKAAFEIPANFTVLNTAKTYRIGQVTGEGALGGNCAFTNSSWPSGSNTWQVGSENDFTFKGTVASDAKFTKMGEGKMTTSGVWTTNGAVNVNAGELHVNAKSTLGTGALTVAKGASLTGLSASLQTGTSGADANPMTNASYTVNGLLQCGTSSTGYSGFWNFNKKNVTFSATGILRVGLNKCATASAPGCATIYNINTLTMNDGATISAFLSKNYTPTQDEAKADSFRIFFDVNTVKLGTLNFDLPDLPVGNYWDTSKVSEGYLYVYYKPVDGDINGDGKLDAADIVAMFKMYLGLEPQSDKCDLNGDGAFTLADITMLVKLIAQ